MYILSRSFPPGNSFILFIVQRTYPKLMCSETEPYLHTLYDTHSWYLTFVQCCKNTFLTLQDSHPFVAEAEKCKPSWMFLVTFLHSNRINSHSSSCIVIPYTFRSSDYFKQMADLSSENRMENLKPSFWS